MLGLVRITRPNEFDPEGNLRRLGSMLEQRIDVYDQLVASAEQRLSCLLLHRNSLENLYPTAAIVEKVARAGIRIKVTEQHISELNALRRVVVGSVKSSSSRAAR